MSWLPTCSIVHWSVPAAWGRGRGQGRDICGGSVRATVVPRRDTRTTHLLPRPLQGTLTHGSTISAHLLVSEGKHCRVNNLLMTRVLQWNNVDNFTL